MVEIPRGRAGTVAKLLYSFVCGGLGVMMLLLADLRTAAGLLLLGLVFAVFGVVGFVTSLRNLITNPPQLRADASGLRFGAGRLIRWHEVDAVFVTQFKIRTNFIVTTKVEKIGITFRRWTTRLSLPVSQW